MGTWLDTCASLNGSVFNIEVDGVWCTAGFSMPGVVSNGEIFIKKRDIPAKYPVKLFGENINWFDIAFTFRVKDNYVSLIEGYTPGNDKDRCIIVPNNDSPLYPAALSFIFPDRTEIIALDDLPRYDRIYCKTIIQSVIYNILQDLV